MNIKMINVENAQINDIFENYEQLIGEISNFIQSNLDVFCTIRKTIDKKNNIYNCTYQRFRIDAYENDCISAEIYGIYQKGIIIKIIAHSNPGIYKYDTITSGLLIFKENENPKLIIDTIDGRIEHNRIFTNTNQSKLFINVNQLEIKQELDKLGQRIDKNYVGRIKNNIFYNETKYQQKNDILKENIKILIIKHIQKLECSKKASVTPIKKQRIKLLQKRRFRNN